MILTEPRVYLIAATALRKKAVMAWLESIGGLKVLDAIAGSDSEQLVELSARRCYKSFDVGLNPNISKVRTDSKEYHDNILKQRHGSVMAHAHVTFAFEDVSRVYTHEVVRNSTGNDISQESLRYVRLNDIPFWLPPEIAQDPIASAKFTEWVQTMEGWQKWLADHFKIEEMPDFNKKKKLTSIFRRVAPLGLATGIVVTFNIRSLRWIIEQRTSRHAEHEIRMVFDQVAQIARDEWPFLFPDFEVELVDGVNEWMPRYSKV
jgi:thymidylate synthase (FAD)